jgi:hypothetical protein
MLRPLIKRPTIGVIRQRRQGDFIATLTGMESQDTSSVLPALGEIGLSATNSPICQQRSSMNLKTSISTWSIFGYRMILYGLPW